MLETELYRIHPYANLLPMPAERDMAALIESIRTHGQIEPIRILDNQIVDGRCRYFACNEIGVTPKTAPWDGPTEDGELLAALLEINISRRQLSMSQRIAVAADAFEAFSKIDPFASRKSTARSCGLDDRFVQLALDIKCERPDLYSTMLSGDIETADALKDYKQGKTADQSPETEPQPDSEKKPPVTPKLKLPNNAPFGIWFYGTLDELKDLMDQALKENRQHMLASLVDGKWVTEHYSPKK